MNWRDASEFFAMGGYGLYVWGAYGVMLVAMVVEPMLVWRRHQAALASVRDRVQDESMEARP